MSSSPPTQTTRSQRLNTEPSTHTRRTRNCSCPVRKCPPKQVSSTASAIKYLPGPAHVCHRLAAAIGHLRNGGYWYPRRSPDCATASGDGYVHADCLRDGVRGRTPRARHRRTARPQIPSASLGRAARRGVVPRPLVGSCGWPGLRCRPDARPPDPARSEPRPHPRMAIPTGDCFRVISSGLRDLWAQDFVARLMRPHGL